VLVFVNLMFLGLGALLLMHAEASGMEAGKPDLLFARVALDGGLGIALPVLFLLGLVAAALSSADSALTALTTSICVDFLDVDAEAEGTAKGKAQRQRIHLWVSVGVGLLILLFHAVNDTSVIAALFKIASYTYGPLLGLFAFALSHPGPHPKLDPWIPAVAILAPAAGWALEQLAVSQGFSFGFALLPVNGFLTWSGAWLVAQFGQKD
jgi:Na+/proline symporter